MKRIGPPIVLGLLFLLSAAAARAQFAVYGQFSATNVPGDAFFATTAAWHKGFSAGAYDDFLHAGPIGLGFDLRGGYGTANGLGAYNFLVGPRLAVKPPLLPIRPYVQASVGLGGIEYNNGTKRYTGRLQYGFVGGLDYTLFPHLDLRLPEIAYTRTKQAEFSGGAAPVHLITVSAGIVLRLR